MGNKDYGRTTSRADAGNGVVTQQPPSMEERVARLESERESDQEALHAAVAEIARLRKCIEEKASRRHTGDLNGGSKSQKAARGKTG